MSINDPDERSSASAGDYWKLADDEPLRDSDGEPMVLAVSCVMYQDAPSERSWMTTPPCPTTVALTACPADEDGTQIFLYGLFDIIERMPYEPATTSTHPATSWDARRTAKTPTRPHGGSTRPT